MLIPKRKRNRDQAGGIVQLFNDLEIYFSQVVLAEITEFYEQGYSVEAIAKVLDRDPDEIFLALFHQARRNALSRPFAKRMEKERVNV